MNDSSEREGPRKLGHVHLKVRDIERSVAFYTDVLGLAVEERRGRYAFLTYDKHHHDVALQAVQSEPPEQTAGVGLYHAAFEVGDADALEATYRRLAARGVDVSPVDHGISRALYFDDPSGNGLEVYLDTRERNDRETWRGKNDPFDPVAP